MEIDLRTLIGKLTPTARRALEAAAGQCIAMSHYEVELEHWLLKLVEQDDSDLPRILRHFELDPARVLASLQRALEGFKTGNTRRPELATVILDAAREAWILASVNLGQARVRSGALLLAVLSDEFLRRRLVEVHSGLREINRDTLARDFVAIVGGSAEDREVIGIGGGTASAAAPSTAGGALAQFTYDLTAQAREDRLDPVLGRDGEIRQLIDILGRKRQNNPILTGEAGVGKTAVVEGLAQRIVAEEVPPPLRDVALHTLDLALLQAGASVKGEFENRLRQVIEEVRGSAHPIILFIDEAHSLIGAGGSAGQGDAANLLKPALARGELRTIAATTWAEYKKFFEKDAALARRFQVVKVEEPAEPAAIEMMRAMAGKLESHHRVWIRDDAIVESVKLSARYIPARQLPDKSVSVLDTACARVAIAQGAVPAAIEDARRRLEALDREIRFLEREERIGASHADRLGALLAERKEVEQRMEGLEARWEKERELVGEIGGLRSRLAGEAEEAEEGGERSSPTLQRSRLAELERELRELQAEEALVLPEVDGQAVADVVSRWTGVPVGKMVADEIHSVLSLADRLRERVIGQDHALDTIARRIRTSRAGLDNPSRPVGVFLLVGPSGVGKTETALALADELYGGERNVVTINMSEFQEQHTVSTLKGSPPGYVGYGEGGVLTEAVRRRPYSVVLLDEVEKAHPDVMEIFFQVFDKGVLEDAEGREIDFKNTLILLTSNVGSDTILRACSDPEQRPDPEAVAEAIRPELLRCFPAALLGRLVVVPYFPVAAEVLRQIVRLQLERVRRRLRESHRADFAFDESLVEIVAGQCDEPESGARAVDRILTHGLLPAMSGEVLGRMAEGRGFDRVEAVVDEGGTLRFKLS